MYKSLCAGNLLNNLNINFKILPISYWFEVMAVSKSPWIECRPQLPTLKSVAWLSLCLSLSLSVSLCLSLSLSALILSNTHQLTLGISISSIIILDASRSLIISPGKTLAFERITKRESRYLVGIVPESTLKKWIWMFIWHLFKISLRLSSNNGVKMEIFSTEIINYDGNTQLYHKQSCKKLSSYSFWNFVQCHCPETRP